MPVRFIPEEESRYLTEDDLALAYRMFADEKLYREVVEKTLNEAVTLSQAGGCPVSGDLIEILFRSVCGRHSSPGAEEYPLC